MLQPFKTNLEKEVLLDGQLSLQLSEVCVHEGIRCQHLGLVLQLLEEVLLDGQLSLHLSGVGVREAYAAHSWG